LKKLFVFFFSFCNCLMSNVKIWLYGLGKCFASYPQIFQDNGINDLALVGDLEISDMVSDMGIKPFHARVIYRRYRRDFADAQSMNRQASVSEPADSPKSQLITADDDEKIDADVLSTLVLNLKSIFPNSATFEKIVKLAEVDAIVLKALALFNMGASHIKKLKNNLSSPTWRGFLSHVQKDSADLCRSLFYGLKEKNTRVWLDMDAGRLDKRGITEGIAESSYFVIIATKDYFKRPWPVFELLTAIALEKPIIVAVEADSRHGGMSFPEFMKFIPEPFTFLKKHELVKIERRSGFWQATLSELSNRLNKKSRIEISQAEDFEKRTKESTEAKLRKTIVRLQKELEVLKLENQELKHVRMKKLEGELERLRPKPRRLEKRPKRQRNRVKIKQKELANRSVQFKHKELVEIGVILKIGSAAPRSVLTNLVYFFNRIGDTQQSHEFEILLKSNAGVENKLLIHSTKISYPELWRMKVSRQDVLKIYSISFCVKSLFQLLIREFGGQTLNDIYNVIIGVNRRTLIGKI